MNTIEQLQSELRKINYEAEFTPYKRNDKLYLRFEGKIVFTISLTKHEKSYYIKLKLNVNQQEDSAFRIHFSRSFPLLFPFIQELAKKNKYSFLQFSDLSFSSAFPSKTDTIQYFTTLGCFKLDDMSLIHLYREKIIPINGSSCFFLLDKTIFPTSLQNMKRIQEGIVILQNQGFVFDWKSEMDFQYGFYCAGYKKRYHVKFEEDVPCVYENENLVVRVNSPEDFARYFIEILERFPKQRKMESLFFDFIPPFLSNRFSYISRNGISRLYKSLNKHYTYHELGTFYQNKDLMTKKVSSLYGKFFFEKALEHYILFFLGDKEYIVICENKEELMRQILLYSEQEAKQLVDIL